MWTMGTTQLALTICSCALASVWHYRRPPRGKETPHTRRLGPQPHPLSVLSDPSALTHSVACGLQATSSGPVNCSASLCHHQLPVADCLCVVGECWNQASDVVDDVMPDLQKPTPGSGGVCRLNGTPGMMS